MNFNQLKKDDGLNSQELSNKYCCQSRAGQQHLNIGLNEKTPVALLNTSMKLVCYCLQSQIIRSLS